LIDSSVLLDIMAPSAWRDWSERQLALALEAGEVAINQIIYAEIAIGFATPRRLERALKRAGIRRLALPWASSWLVAEAFARYRRAGGPRALPLPDSSSARTPRRLGSSFSPATPPGSGPTSPR